MDGVKTEITDKKGKREIDFTGGNLFWKVPLFALPMALTTMLQTLYTTVDLWTVSNFGGGSLSMSAIGSNSALINLIITVVTQMSLGANVAIANAKGANDAKSADTYLHTALWLALISGLFVAVFGYAISPLMLTWMGTPASIYSNAVTYMQIYFIGVPLNVLYNYESQILRGLGDSRRPLYILVISGLVNVLFDYVFVAYGGMDVAGVAWATVLSELVSATLGFLWLYFNKKGFVIFRFSHFKINKDALFLIIKIGLPAGIQGLAFCLPNVLIQSSLYTITDYYIDGTYISVDEIVIGASASAQIEGYIYALIEACSAACLAMTGQNYGAKKIENFRKCYWYSLVWMLIFSAVSGCIAGFFAEPLLRIFVTESEGLNTANAVAAGKERLLLFAITYFLDGIMDISGSYIRGMRHSTTPSVVTLIGCTGFRIVFLYTIFVQPYFHTVFWLYAAFPISWIIISIAYIPIVLHVEKKEMNSLRRPVAA